MNMWLVLILAWYFTGVISSCRWALNNRDKSLEEVTNHEAD